jgi:hypothetical protein
MDRHILSIRQPDPQRPSGIIKSSLLSIKSFQMLLFQDCIEHQLLFRPLSSQRPR